MSTKQYQAYAPRWHMLEFHGHAAADIARQYGTDEETVKKFIASFREANGFASPAEVKAANKPARHIEKLSVLERDVLGAVLSLSRDKLSTSLTRIAQHAGKPRPVVIRVLRSLAAKQYIELRRHRHSTGQFALALLDLKGHPWTEEGAPLYVVNKEGVKRYSKAMYCQGYGWKRPFKIGMTVGEI